MWEASHTGGHRFAPTGVLLPHGVTLARLDAELVDAVLAAPPPASCRPPSSGRATTAVAAPLAPGAQAAESHVRHLVGERSLTAFTVTEVAAGPATPGEGPSAAATQRFVVSHNDGRNWDVRCERRTAAVEMPESCGKVAVHPVDWAPVVVS